MFSHIQYIAMTIRSSTCVPDQVIVVEEQSGYISGVIGNSSSHMGQCMLRIQGQPGIHSNTIFSYIQYCKNTRTTLISNVVSFLLHIILKMH